MDRQTFFEAQLWLRQVDEREFVWPERDQPSPCGVAHILPPLTRTLTLPHGASPARPASQSQRMEVASCSGSFHSASRICYFRSTDANEDQTLLIVEIVVAEPQDGSKPSSMFMRLDQHQVYEVAVSEILSVIPPERPRASAPNNLPPFGSLDFGSVSLRLWLDPQDTPVAEARVILVDALRRVEKLRSQRRAHDLLEKEKPNLWVDCFRHNRWVARRKVKEAGDPLLDTALLLRRGQETMSSDADREALKMVISNFMQKKGRSARNQGLTGIQEDVELMQTPPAPEQAPAGGPLSEQEFFDLVASLVHVFGEDHQGLRKLLGPSDADECKDHEGCLRLAGEASPGCVMQKWQRWDDFLQLSNDVFFQPNKRQRTSRSSEYETEVDTEDTFQAAGEAFVSAIIGLEEDKHFKVMQRTAKERMRSLEDAAFTALFPMPTKSTAMVATPVKNARQQAEPLTPVTPQRAQTAPRQSAAPATPQNLTHSKAEHTFNFLLESRRALIRQELTVACLPRRARQVMDQ